jgi:hypothetical protein
MNIELALGRSLTTLGTRPVIAFQDDLTDLLPGSLLFGRSLGHQRTEQSVRPAATASTGRDVGGFPGSTFVVSIE